MDLNRVVSKHRMFFFFMLFILGSHHSWAGDLLDERLLHPGDGFTAQVMHKDEWSYNQPMLPLPGWALWGATEQITIELDFMAWLFGVPDVNVRWALTNPDDKNWGLAWETMAMYFPYTFEGLKNTNPDLLVNRHGPNAYTRLNASYTILPNVRLQASLGISYSESLQIASGQGETRIDKSFEHYCEPIGSIGMDWRIASWISANLNASYGETFVFMENRPRKQQLTYGFIFAPFLYADWGFLHNLRIETTALFFSFPDVNQSYFFPFPLYPLVYWQWNF